MNNKELQVSALIEGTVIDHIPADMLFEVINILKLDQVSNQVTFGTNLTSQKLGKKAIIKIAHHFFEEQDYNKIAIVAPDAVLNEIHDYKVAKKRHVKIPEEVKSFIKCFNPVCITNKQPIPTRFKVFNQPQLKLVCHYCEKTTHKKEITFI